MPTLYVQQIRFAAFFNLNSICITNLSHITFDYMIELNFDYNHCNFYAIMPFLE